MGKCRVLIEKKLLLRQFQGEADGVFGGDGDVEEGVVAADGFEFPGAEFHDRFAAF